MQNKLCTNRKLCVIYLYKFWSVSHNIYSAKKIICCLKNIYIYKESETIVKFADNFNNNGGKLYLTSVLIKAIYYTLGYGLDMLYIKTKFLFPPLKVP